MKKMLSVFVASTLLAAAGAAAPQTPSPASSPEKSPEPAAKAGTRLKLRLDELGPSQPPITFGQRDGAGAQGAAGSLPSLGPSRSRSLEQPAPFPKDTEQQYR